MSTSDLFKQYYNVFSSPAKTFDGKNESVTKDRGFFLFGKPSPRKKLLKPKKKTKKTAVPSKKTKVKSSAVFLSQGREEFYKAYEQKLNTAHISYNVNYIDPYKSVPDFNLRPSTVSKMPKGPTQSQVQLVDKPSAKIKLPLNFSKQLPRSYSYFELNEKRFQTFNLSPEIHSSVKRICTPNLSKGRGHDFQATSSSNMNTYNAKLEPVIKKSNRLVPDFKKYRARQSLALEHLNDLEYDVNFGLTVKSSPSFKIKSPKQ